MYMETYAYGNYVNHSILFFLILSHQCRVSQQLLQGIDTKFTVNILVVVAESTFLDRGDHKDFFYGPAVQIVFEDLALRRSQCLDAIKEPFIIIRIDFGLTRISKP